MNLRTTCRCLAMAVSAFVYPVLTQSLPTTFAQEVEYNWTNAGPSGFFIDPENWGINNGTTPLGPGAIVNINGGLAFPVIGAEGSGGSLGIGVLNIGSGGGLDVNGGTLSMAAPTATQEFSMQNSGSLNITGDTAAVALNDQVANFSLASINLHNGGSLVLSNSTFIGTSNLDVGNGTINLSNGAGETEAKITGAAGVFLVVEKQTVQGFGLVGDNRIGLSFDSDTLVDANTGGQSLVLDSGAGGVINAGTLRASGGGNLVLQDSAIDNTSGVIEALSGSSIDLTNGYALSGGTLRRVGTGTIDLSGTGSLANLMLDVTSVGIVNGQDLTLAGTIDNRGDISLSTNFSNTDLRTDDSVILTGGGSVTMGGAAISSRIVGDDGVNDVLTNVNNTIGGKGFVGGGSVQINNEVGGTIDANNSTGSLNLNPVTGSAMVNRGLMTATAGGDLRFNAGEYDNAGGLIEVGDDSTITLGTGSRITGGTVRDVGTGRFTMSNVGTLRDLTIEGQMDVTNGQDLALEGTIDNRGNISLSTNFSNTDLQIDDAVILTGGGTVTLGGEVSSGRIVDSAGSDGVLTNLDNTIRGKGFVGNGSVQLVNEVGGTLDGSDDTGTLAVSAASASINRGLFTASNGGDLSLVGGEFDNSAGLIEPSSGSSVTIGGTARVVGGQFNAADGSTIKLTGTGEIVGANLGSAGTGKYESTSGAAKLTDVTNESSVTIFNGADLNLAGSIDNRGDISLSTNFSFTDLRIDDSVSLIGGGTVTLGGPVSSSRITGDDGTSDVLTNVNNTIRGKGDVGNGSVQVNNEAGGTIDANDSTGSLSLNPVLGSSMVNRGLLTATTGGDLRFNAGEYDNAGGLIEVGDDSTITLVTGSRITGGTVRDVGTGRFAMSNGGTLGDLTIEGRMDVTNGQDLALEGTIDNRGDISISTNFSNTDLQIDDSVILTGGGTVTLGGAVSNSRIIDSAGSDGVLTNLDNTIRGKGFVSNVTLNNQGTIIAEPGNLTLQNTTFDNAGGTVFALLDGTGFAQSGRIAADTAIDLAGELGLAVGESFSATVGETFQILTATSLNGFEFDSLNLDATGDYEFGVNYGVGFVEVEVLSISLGPVNTDGDFDNDGDVDADDIDFYSRSVGNLVATGSLAELNLNSDGVITLADHNIHVQTLVQTSNGLTGTLLGDANLDGTVDVLQDASRLVQNLGASGQVGFADGDFNADGRVDVLGDAALLIQNLGLSNSSAATPNAAAVPEPGAALLLLGVLARLSVSRRKRDCCRNQ